VTHSQLHNVECLQAGRTVVIGQLSESLPDPEDLIVELGELFEVGTDYFGLHDPILVHPQQREALL
jgi:hypothetical protein